MSARATRSKRNATTHPASIPPPVSTSVDETSVQPAMPVPRQRRGGKKVITASTTPAAQVMPEAPAVVGKQAGRKRTLSKGTREAAAAVTKRAKQVAYKGATSDVPVPPTPGESAQAPKRAHKVVPVLQEADFEESGDESTDLPVSAGAAHVHGTAPNVGATGDEDAVNDGELSDGHSGDEDELDRELEELSESEDELLTSLGDDPVKLGAHLAAEVPTWTEDITAPLSAFGGPAGKGKGKAQVPDGYAIVEVDSESGQSSQGDSGGRRPKQSAVDNEPGSSSLTVQETKRANKSSAEKSAGRLQARQQLERPFFKVVDTAPASPSPESHSAAVNIPSSSTAIDPAPDSHTGDLISDDDGGAPALSAGAYKIIFPAQGGPLSLKAQHPDVQDVIRATARRLERDILTRDAFPDAHNRGRSVCMAMVETVKKMVPASRYVQLATRMITDGPFTRLLSSIPNQRISNFRGKVKEKSDIAVASAYGLVPGKAQDRVDWLISELIYVYPTEYEARTSPLLMYCIKKTIAEGKPYQHPIVVSVLREAFFKGPKSFASKNTDIFVSSMPQRLEKEIPMVMLALAGAAIHASLMDWKSGDFIVAGSFLADKYVDAYNEHMTFLKGIKLSSAVKYHTMMYKLYEVASGAVPVHSSTTCAGSTALTRLNIDAMDED